MAKLISKDVVVALATDPQSLKELTGISKSSDLTMLPLSTNSGEVFIGSVDNQLFPIGTGLSISDFMSMRGEQEWDLSKIFIRVATDGEGLHILLSGR